MVRRARPAEAPASSAAVAAAAVAAAAVEAVVCLSESLATVGIAGESNVG